MAGQVFVFFILTVAAAESAIGLAILVVLFRNRSTIRVDELDTLKDQIYVLHCAVIDARTDLAAGRHTKDSLLEMVNWLLEAADPVAAASLSPSLRP
jgi:hypothetical protein